VQAGGGPDRHREDRAQRLGPHGLVVVAGDVAGHVVIPHLQRPTGLHALAAEAEARGQLQVAQTVAALAHERVEHHRGVDPGRPAEHHLGARPPA
jgi:hypothetical protein